MNKRKARTPERDAKVIKLYNEGLTQRQVADRLGMSAKTVSDVLRDNHVKIDTQPRFL